MFPSSRAKVVLHCFVCSDFVSVDPIQSVTVARVQPNHWGDYDGMAFSKGKTPESTAPGSPAWSFFEFSGRELWWTKDAFASRFYLGRDEDIFSTLLRRLGPARCGRRASVVDVPRAESAFQAFTQGPSSEEARLIVARRGERSSTSQILAFPRKITGMLLSRLIVVSSWWALDLANCPAKPLEANAHD
ncbi:hypothetical protein SELMODRAFT_411247 [Selaginella moellendorffii]|uniref:Uncharacterized protein n=1 Tax=Selaginella moellendorffii TaxID=88036 RepID=D8RH18_SELML|nr:hypothetical protein SELMODRAFT_411247 [Selaginella moellendorffii]